MKQIKLQGKNGIGKFTLVDDEDYEYLNQWKWYYADGYARRLDSIDERRVIFAFADYHKDSLFFCKKGLDKCVSFDIV